MKTYRCTLKKGGKITVRAYNHEHLLKYLDAIKFTWKIEKVNGNEFIPF